MMQFTDAYISLNSLRPSDAYRLTITGSDNGLSPGRRQAIFWTNAGILLIGPLGTNFSENSIEILSFSFTKIRLKVSSSKWRPFCLGLNVLYKIVHQQSLWDSKSKFHCVYAWHKTSHIHHFMYEIGSDLLHTITNTSSYPQFQEFAIKSTISWRINSLW